MMTKDINMNKAFFLRVEDKAPRWREIDATGKVLGRLCTEIATALRGKDKATYTPQTDAGDYVIVTNCEKIVLTGNKMRAKMYASFSGYRGGLKETAARDVMAKNPAHLIEAAVKGMLPKTIMGRAMIKKLRVYAGNEHPHSAQVIGFPVK